MLRQRKYCEDHAWWHYADEDGCKWCRVETTWPAVLNKPDPVQQRYLPADSAERKRFPLCTGLLDYFPDACAAVAEVSYQGNEKHNPGQPLHHARGKSMDHADCIMRHLAERGGFDGPTRHSASLAWRALALLQEELEREKNLTLPRGATPPGVELA